MFNSLRTFFKSSVWHYWIWVSAWRQSARALFCHNPHHSQWNPNWLWKMLILLLFCFIAKEKITFNPCFANFLTPCLPTHYPAGSCRALLILLATPFYPLTPHIPCSYYLLYLCLEHPLPMGSHQGLTICYLKRFPTCFLEIIRALVQRHLDSKYFWLEFHLYTIIPYSQGYLVNIRPRDGEEHCP